MTNSYDVFIPEIWSKKLANMLDKKCVMLQCVNRNWEGEIAEQGDTVKIISPAAVSVSTLSSSDISYSELEPLLNQKAAWEKEKAILEEKAKFADEVKAQREAEAKAKGYESSLEMQNVQKISLFLNETRSDLFPKYKKYSNI